MSVIADRKYLAGLRHWLWLLLLAGLLTGAAAYAGSKKIVPTYRASATLLVSATASPNQFTYSDALLSQQLTQTYSKMVVMEPVLAQVIQDGHLPFNLQQLQEMVSVTPVAQTQLITITVNTHSAQQAESIANLVANTFITQQHARIANGESPNVVTVVEPATVPRAPISPKALINVALGVLFGLLAAGIVVTLMIYLDDTLKSEQDVERTVQLPLLGIVRRDHSQAVLTLDPNGIVQEQQSAEVFRVVRANVEFATVATRARVLQVTSSEKGEGKSTTAAKLAVAIAETGKRVILVDADLRAPMLHHTFNLSNVRGLTNLLVDIQAGAAYVERYLQPTPLPLQILTSGPLPPNPAEMLHSDAMTDLLRSLQEHADVVVVDTPPLLAVADAMTLAPKMEGVIFVIESGRVRVGSITEALARLRRAGTPVLGVVLNKVTRETEGYYYYAYQGYYGGPSGPKANGSVTRPDDLSPRRSKPASRV